ncbi:hypothetical protein D3C85_1567890 [compost metagenome]
MIDVATVEFVVTADVNHRTGKGLAGPDDASRFRVDIARQDDQIRGDGWCLEDSKFVVQV